MSFACFDAPLDRALVGPVLLHVRGLDITALGDGLWAMPAPAPVPYVGVSFDKGVRWGAVYRYGWPMWVWSVRSSRVVLLDGAPFALLVGGVW